MLKKKKYLLINYLPPVHFVKQKIPVATQTAAFCRKLDLFCDKLIPKHERFIPDADDFLFL